jgi:tetratricopeptide (TPR) repeat protein
MSHCIRIESVLGLCILACVLLYSDDKDVWLEVKSPNFTVISNGSVGQAQHVARSLEQFRAVFQSALPELRVDPGYPLIVFAVRDDQSLKTLVSVVPGNAERLGTFLAGPERNLIAFRLDLAGDMANHVIYHEYAHVIVQLNYETLPLWLSEGLAELYGYATVANRSAGLGKTSREFLRILKSSRMIPLDILMNAGADSPLYRQREESQIFYAQSWALTHYLLLGDNRTHSAQVKEYLRLLRDKVPPQGAIQRAFGDLAELRLRLEKYVKGYRIDYYPTKARFVLDENNYPARTLSAAESRSYRGWLLTFTNRLDEARAMLEEALRLDSRNVSANEAMGFLALRLHDRDQARRYLQVAADSGSTSFLTQYYAAQLALEQSGANTAIAAGYLHNALEISPNSVPASDMLAQVLLTQETQLPEALELAQKVAGQEPGNWQYRVRIGWILLKMGRMEESSAVGETLRDSASTPEERGELDSLLFQIRERRERVLDTARRVDALREAQQKEAQQREAVEPEERTEDQDLSEKSLPKRTGPVKKRRGFVQSVTCNSSAILDVVLTSNGKQHKFRAENYYRIQYRTIGFLWKTAFEPCTDLGKRRIEIEYWSVSGQEYSGVIKSIAIEKRSR